MRDRPTALGVGRVCCLALGVLLLAGPLRGDPAIASRPSSGGIVAPPTEADRRRAHDLARQAITLIEHKDLDGAEARLREALAILPDKSVWHYNLACILAARQRDSAALDELEQATRFGFTDFTLLENNPGFSRLRALPRFAALMARKEEITHHAARQAVAELEKRFGSGYLYEVDEDRKLIFATNTDRRTLDALKTWLIAQTKSQEEELFEHKPDEFIRVVVPSGADFHRLMKKRGVIGIYEDETRTLLAQHLGQVMTHEFTHALHAADQRAVGQEHPVWLREGLAAMYEAGEFDEAGRLIPHDNFRLGFVQSAGRRKALIPFDKMLALKLKDFEASPNLAYGQTSSLMLYLYEQKLLRKFYDAYKRSFASDPSGRMALEEVTGQKLNELQTTWTQWMLAREAPRLAGVRGGAFLGVHFGDANDGLKITFVVPDTPAWRAGLKAGDVIVGLDGHEVRDYPSFAPILTARAPGDDAKLKVRRDGKYIDVTVVLGKR